MWATYWEFNSDTKPVNGYSYICEAGHFNLRESVQEKQVVQQSQLLLWGKWMDQHIPQSWLSRSRRTGECLDHQNSYSCQTLATVSIFTIMSSFTSMYSNISHIKGKNKNKNDHNFFSYFKHYYFHISDGTTFTVSQTSQGSWSVFKKLWICRQALDESLQLFGGWN